MKMKKVYFLLPLLWMLLICSSAFTQSGKIPPFRMTQPDGKLFKAEDLPMGKPIIIIYFSPDCDHCDNLMKNLLKQPEDFNKASIAMITYLPIESVIKFVKKYNLKKYPNIYVGTEEGSLFVRNYYHIQQMPFVALYSKNGDRIKSYISEVPLKDLAGRLSTIK